MNYPTLKLDQESFAQYVSTALWATTDDDGVSLDANYFYDDVKKESLELHRSECKKFIKANYTIIINLVGAGYEMATIMHDFWLTRNGHGCGFWDGDYPPMIGYTLTESAHSFGQAEPYIGNDDCVYLS